MSTFSRSAHSRSGKVRSTPPPSNYFAFPAVVSILGEPEQPPYIRMVRIMQKRSIVCTSTAASRAAPVLDEALPEGNAELVGTLQRRRPRCVWNMTKHTHESGWYVYIHVQTSQPRTVVKIQNINKVGRGARRRGSERGHAEKNLQTRAGRQAGRVCACICWSKG